MVNKFINKCVLILRFKEFDTHTSDGRSKERYRRVALTALSTGIAKFVSILTVIISVPLTVSYLGTERYGLWMTISSIVLMMGFADLGMGNGLTNVISEAHGNGDHHAALQHVSSAFYMLLGVAAFIMAAFSLAYFFINWASLFNVKSELAIKEAGPATAVFVLCFSLNLPLGVVQRVQLGYQQGFINNIWETLARIIGLVGLLIGIHLKASLTWLVLTMAATPVLGSILNSIILFGFKSPWLRPRWSEFSYFSAVKIFRLGIFFLLAQIGWALALSSDNFVIARILGAKEVAQYSISNNMFSLGLLISTVIFGPLWPAYGEAIARGDLSWAKRTLNRSLVLTIFLVGLPSLFFIIFGANIVHLWVGPEITPSFSLLLGLGIFTTLSALGHTTNYFLCGANILRFQAFCIVLMAFGALIAKIFLCKLIGLPGIIWGTLIAYSVLFALPYCLYVPKLLNNYVYLIPNRENN